MSAQLEAFAKLTRQAYVIAAYRWLIEVMFLFAAFSSFPDYKWPVGLAILVFSGGIQSVILVMQAWQQQGSVRADEAERKTRHAIVLAAEMAAQGAQSIDQGRFWGEVNARVKEEREELDFQVDRPVGFWTGFALASGSLIWQVVASLIGIGIVAILSGG